MFARTFGPQHFSIRRMGAGWLALAVLACGSEEPTAPELPIVLASTGSILGSKIAFQSNRDGGDVEIYVMNPDGSAQTRLTTSAGADANPDWSPDGRRLAFASFRIPGQNLATGRIQCVNHRPIGAHRHPMNAR